MSDVRSESDALEHYGVLGMKWGQTRAKGGGFDINVARTSVAGKKAKYAQMVRNAKSIRDKGQRAVALAEAKRVKAANLNDPDRVLAARLTRGEKIVSAAFFGPIGLGAIAISSVHSRRIEQKQDKGKYDES